MVFEYFLLLRFFLDLKSTKENGKASLVQEIILLGGVSLLGLLMIVVMFLLIGLLGYFWVFLSYFVP